MPLLEDKVCVITGGAGSLGLASARLFLREGAKVIGISRDPANLAAAQQALAGKGLTVDVEAVDLTDPEAAAAAFEFYRRRFKQQWDDAQVEIEDWIRENP